MRHSTLALALAAWGMAAFAGAQLSQEYKDWPDSPVSFLLTKAERKAYAEVKSDAEAKAFIELFWARRDPNLDTPVNEFKADYDMRVDAADKYFSYGSTKGSLSDRGHVLIVLGKYVQRLIYKPGELNQMGGEPGSREELSGGNEVWKYTKAQIPAGVKGDDFVFVFSESRPGTNDFVLDRGDRRNTAALRILGAVPDALLLHPKLTEVPRLGLLPGSKSANVQQLAVLSVEPRPWPPGAAMLGASGVQSETLRPFWLYVQLPDSVPVATQVVGRVVSAEGGQEAGSFVAAAKPVTVTGGNAYELSLPLDPGKWRIDLALLKDATPVGVTSYDATVDPVVKEGTFISQLYWGVDVRQEVKAYLGDPFNVGGWHVLPRPDGIYASSDQLSYFCFVVRPGIPEAPAPASPAAGAAPGAAGETAPAAAAAAQAPPKPKLEISIKLFAGDKKVQEVPATPVNISQIRGDVWMYGNGLPLEGFKKAGDYRLEVTLHDTITNTSRTSTIPVKIAAPPAAAPAAAPTK